MEYNTPKFSIGDIISHKLFNYRAVIFDVDPYYQGTDKWYELNAKSRPSKDSPWYHVMVHNANHICYVAEQNLQRDNSGQEIVHPDIDNIFSELKDGKYQIKYKMN